MKRLTVNSGILELPRRNLVVKQQVNLAKSAVFRLREAEPAPNVAEKIGPGVEQTGFGSPIPSYAASVSIF